MEQNSILIWIFSRIENIDRLKCIEEFKTFKFHEMYSFTKIEDAIEKIKELNFVPTFIIASGKIYIKFIKEFDKNLEKIKIIPKIIIFEKNKEAFIEKNKEEKKYLNSNFYNYGGIKTNLEEIKQFLNDLIKDKITFKKDTDIADQITFDFIDSKEKLGLPLFFKCLIDITKKDKVDKFIDLLCDKYLDNSIELKILLKSIKSMPGIPIPLLSKYFVRIYTSEKDKKDKINFYYELNSNLRGNKKDVKDQYLPFIKVLYEGVRLKSLPMSKAKKLYRGTSLPNKEIQKIKEYSNQKIQNLPGGILFSRAFLSFSEDKNVVKNFFDNSQGNTNNNFSKVLFILKKEDSTGYNLSTHADIDEFSFFSEKEVLFFPFSCFQIENIEEKTINNQKLYEIKLLYLGKYLKEIENDEEFQNNQNPLPESNLKEEIKENGLVEEEKIDTMTVGGLCNIFKKYEDSIGKNVEIIKSIPQDNYIKGVLNIGEKFVNKEIKIINSFEQSKRDDPNNDILNNRNENEYNNEEEIKDNCEITIDEQKINFSYFHKFNNPGDYEIKYLFKDKLTNSSYMFNKCNCLTNLDLSHFDSKDITNMESMFNSCESLKQINLSNLNTLNVTNMSCMFNKCLKLENLDVSNLNTKNVTKMDYLFDCCNKIKELDLSNFNTEKVINMGYMFFECESLEKINVSNFNTQNVTNMKYMFYNCISLKSLNLSNFKTQNVLEMGSMFDGCENLENLDLSNFVTSDNTNIESMFDSCDSLSNAIIKDRNILKMFTKK